MKYYILLIGFLLSSCGYFSEGITFTKDEKYAIYILPDSPASLNYAAEELAKYLTMTTGAVCDIKESKYCMERQLAVMKLEDTPKKAFENSLEASDSDEYSIHVDNNRMLINGSHARGVLYGVYSFLEDFLKCRWYSAKVSHIPFSGTTKIEHGQFQYKSPVNWREVYYCELSDPTLAGIFKLNGNAGEEKEVTPNRFTSSGEQHVGWGYWCHSLYTMVPPSLYDTRPEYFSEIDGKRVAPAGEEGGTQLCLTNPDVLQLAIEKLKVDMDKPRTGLPVWADSTATYWSVSQMDGNGFCTCAACKQLDEYNESPSGSILSFVNKVAAHFPQKKIATLAYIYSRKAPKYVKPASNVAIQLCAIETARDGINHPIATSPIHRAFRNDMLEWGEMCKDIVVWDYVIQFQNLISPFPNFSVMQDNIQFYVKNNATGIFCQGNREKGGEFAELRGYLLSKLLWNPDCDFEATMVDFLNGYYGAAGPYLHEYIKTMEAELKKSGLKLSMDGEPESHREGYLSESCFEQYNKLFDKAEECTKDQPEVLDRVRKERMGLMYVQLRLGYGTINERKAALQQLITLAQSNDVWMLSEVDWREDQSGNREMFEKKMNLLLNK